MVMQVQERSEVSELPVSVRPTRERLLRVPRAIRAIHREFLAYQYPEISSRGGYGRTILGQARRLCRELQRSLCRFCEHSLRRSFRALKRRLYILFKYN